jgi:hypothetical protein
VPPGSDLAEIARDSAGRTSIQVDSSDPESLRAAFSDNLSAGWREASQSRTGRGYRTRFVWDGVTNVEPSRPAAPLAALDREQAIALATRALQTKAQSKVVALELNAAHGAAAAPLEFAVRIAGPQAAVLALADEIESASPAARFTEWRLRPEGEGVRLTGTLAVPWGPSG